MSSISLSQGRCPFFIPAQQKTTATVYCICVTHIICILHTPLNRLGMTLVSRSRRPKKKLTRCLQQIIILRKPKYILWECLGSGLIFHLVKAGPYKMDDKVFSTQYNLRYLIVSYNSTM